MVICNDMQERAMTTLDYAEVFEAEYRPSRRLRRVAARALWTGLLVVRPRLALSILAERRSTVG
jgi:DICT domain-containing protein